MGTGYGIWGLEIVGASLLICLNEKHHSILAA